MLEGKLFITGGAGTLGTAIIKRVKQEGWDCAITIFSRDPMKHHALKKEYPDVVCVVGDITNYLSLSNAMAGHDVVVHAAAAKHIPECEHYPLMAYEVNVSGSINVLEAVVQNNVKKVVGISTDKACHPINSYGCTKMMMERAFQRYAHLYSDIGFHLVRYGNVLGSTGSVVNVWRKMLEEQGKVFATDAGMTRFWLTSQDAVELILLSLTEPSGTITIRLLPATSMAKMAEDTLPEGTKIEYLGLRPGEKRHEELITEEESRFAKTNAVLGTNHVENIWTTLYPVNGKPLSETGETYSSDEPDTVLTKEHLLKMIGELDD